VWEWFTTYIFAAFLDRCDIFPSSCCMTISQYQRKSFTMMAFKRDHRPTPLTSIENKLHSCSTICISDTVGNCVRLAIADTVDWWSTGPESCSCSYTHSDHKGMNFALHLSPSQTNLILFVECVKTCTERLILVFMCYISFTWYLYRFKLRHVTI